MNKSESLEKYKEYVKLMLNSYADTLSRVMFGDFEVRVKSEEDDEFASFAMYLNTLVASLERKNKEVIVKTKELEEAKTVLEKQVAERTKELKARVEELERFNKFAVDRELKMVELKKKIKELERNYKRNERDSPPLV